MDVVKLEPITPMTMLSMAVQQGADLDKLQKLMDLQERWEANEARKAFVSAMTEFKANPPKIVKDKQVAYGQTKYKHAELDQVSSVIGAALAAVGISHAWSLDQSNGISVTCKITHAMGHSESVTMVAPSDTSGQKNAIQAIGSTITYLERYTLLAAAGIATGDDDTDGSVRIMPEDKFQDYCRKIRESKTTEELQKIFTEAYKAAGTDKDTQKALMGIKDSRKSELGASK